MVLIVIENSGNLVFTPYRPKNSAKVCVCKDINAHFLEILEMRTSYSITGNMLKGVTGSARFHRTYRNFIKKLETLVFMNNLNRLNILGTKQKDYSKNNQSDILIA